MRLFLILIICLIAFTLSSVSQSRPTDEIVVIGSASIQAPADRVILRVTISFEDKIDGKKAFAQHKEQEGLLLKVLQSQNIPDSLISYSLLNMASRMDYSSPTPTRVFQTAQTVSIVVTDLQQLPAFELALISNGYGSFEGSFESSKAPEAIKEALGRAVQQAKVKAEIIAAAAGRRIRRMTKVSDTDEIEPRIASYTGLLAKQMTFASRTSVQLINIPQTITVDKQVRAVFQLVE